MEKTAYEKIKRRMIRDAQIQNEFSKTVKVSGERMILPLEGRGIEIVYYSTNKKNSPLILGMHGGGFLFGGCALNDKMYTQMSEMLGANIASIGYRKTPEYRFPSPVLDVFDSAEYLINKVEEFDFDRDEVYIYGNSAGANLAAAACIYGIQNDKNYFKSQILIYPYVDATDKDDDPASQIFAELYSEKEDYENILVSPVFAPDEIFKKLPRAIIAVADIDSLRDGGERYYKRLQEMNVESYLYVAKDMEHGYFECSFLEEGGIFMSETMAGASENGSLEREKVNTLDFIKKHF